jgi:hypothetical protein
MANKTAVEWLIEYIDMQYPDLNILREKTVIDKAKQIEKQQIIDAFVKCWKSNVPDGFECKLSAIEYYNKTYKK